MPELDGAAAVSAPLGYVRGHKARWLLHQEATCAPRAFRDPRALCALRALAAAPLALPPRSSAVSALPTPTAVSAPTPRCIGDTFLGAGAPCGVD